MNWGTRKSTAKLLLMGLDMGETICTQRAAAYVMFRIPC